jgi:hypothetical protein
MINIDECLHNWMFHFNPYTGLWNAFPREEYNNYFNNANDPEALILKSTDIKALLEILRRIKCNPDKIAEL